MTIHDYSYKPKPVFFCEKDEKTKLFFGIELETEKGDSSSLNNLENKFFYLKEDSSLNNGFELVTHPLSQAWIVKNQHKIKIILDTLKNATAKSYNTSTCGMHVHVSKNAISLLQLVKIVKFFIEQKNFILKLSQRKAANLQRWASLDFSNKFVKYVKEKNSSRYVAINLQNQNTIEFRIFRGTLKFESFMKNLEFLFSLLDFTREEGYIQITLDNYSKFLTKNKKDYKNLINFLTEKNILCV